MPIFDLAAAEPPPAAHASVCIVGGGMAGLVLGRSLARAGMQVLTLESGGMAFDETVHALNDVEDVFGRYTRAMTGRYRGLGGSSSRWGGRMVPISRHERGGRDYLDQPSWPVSVLETKPYQAEIEKLFRIAPGSFDEELLERIDPKGAFPRNDDDFVCRWAKWPTFARCNLGSLLRAEIEQRKNWDIWINATVTGFTLDRDRGTLASLTAHGPGGRAITVKAPRFVIAAGTFETTRLLLWMKAQADDHPFARTEALGHYFQDHVMARIASISRQDAGRSNEIFGQHFVDGTRRSLHLELSPQAQREDRVPGAFVYVAMDFSKSPMNALKEVARDLQAGRPDAKKMAGLASSAGFLGRSLYWRYGRRQLFVPPDVPFSLEVVCEQSPNRANRIALSDGRDRFGIPKIKLHWRPGEEDERTFRSVTKRMGRYWRHAGLDKVAPLTWEACAQPDGAIADIAVDYAHPSGTTRMGLAAADSVVDANLRCHEMPNLYLVSASVFPTAGSANPTFTILQLAMRLADHLISQRSAPVAHLSPMVA